MEALLQKSQGGGCSTRCDAGRGVNEHTKIQVSYAANSSSHSWSAGDLRQQQSAFLRCAASAECKRANCERPLLPRSVHCYNSRRWRIGIVRASSTMHLCSCIDVNEHARPPPMPNSCSSGCVSAGCFCRHEQILHGR